MFELQKFEVNKIQSHLKKVDWKNPNNIILYGLGGMALIYVLIWVLQILIYVVIIGVVAWLLFTLYKQKKVKDVKKNG